MAYLLYKYTAMLLFVAPGLLADTHMEIKFESANDTLMLDQEREEDEDLTQLEYKLPLMKGVMHTP